MGSDEILREARSALRDAPRADTLAPTVLRFHRRVDAILEESHRIHRVEVACRSGCSHCCHLQVDVLPPEAFALAEWLRRHRTAEELAALASRVRDNARRTRSLGLEARRRINIPCALLGNDGMCTAYEVRPAQCRRFHSTDLAACEASFAAPDDDGIASAVHPLVAHNAQVVVTLAQHGLRDEGVDAAPVDMNLALEAALEGSRAWRRWRDGKKAFVGVARKALALLPWLLGSALVMQADLD